MKEQLRQIGKYIDPWLNRIRLLVGRGLIKLVNDAGAVQAVQVQALSGEVLNKVERLQEWGFSSHPVPGTKCILLSLMGERGAAYVIATEDGRYRLKVAEGESCIYGKDGQYVKCKDGGEIEIIGSWDIKIDAGGGDITINSTGTVKLEGNAVSGILLGGAATLPVARHNDIVYQNPGPSGPIVGYVNAGPSPGVPRTKVLTE